ncbi:unnamed protein product [Echinostoma caproni]|uniref:Transcription factor Sp1 n=1 Tax=Echinostoma caproni TaxID=27848 RepID=A0A183B2E8_9TREM|nr:unnamed protein product [Echinostoma caproni]
MTAGCYATPQFQFSGTPGGATQQFFLSPQNPGAAGAQTFLQWSAAAPGTAGALHFQPQPTQQANPVAAAWQAVSTMGGVHNSGGTSYHLLPVGCPTSNFTSLLLSDHQQQAQLAQCTNAAAQLQRAQPTIQMQAAQQPQQHQQQPQAPQFHQQQQQQQPQLQSQPQQFQQQQQAQAYIHSQPQAATMLATDVTVSGQPNAASVAGSAPQFITLAPGAPLKVMAVGPNGQLIQTTGLPQFMPTAAVGMTFNQQAQALQSAQPTTVTMTSQRRVATPQQQQQQQQANGRTAISTAAFFAGTTVSSGTIPLVQTAAGGEDLITSAVGPNALSAGDEKLVYTAL